MNDKPKDSPDYEGLVIKDVSVDPIDGSLTVYLDLQDENIPLAREFIESFISEFEGKYNKLT